jgi:hypothetical protein
MPSNTTDLSASMFSSSCPRWPIPILQLTRRCYTTTYNNGGCSTSHASTRGNCLTTASDSDWSVCLQTLSRLQLRLTGLCFDSLDIAFAWTQQKTLFLCWCRCRIACSIVLGLSTWCWTVWQHCFEQLSSCRVMSLETRMWRVPLLHASTALRWLSLLIKNYFCFQKICHTVIMYALFLQNLNSKHSFHPRYTFC